MVDYVQLISRAVATLNPNSREARALHPVLPHRFRESVPRKSMSVLIPGIIAPHVLRGMDDSFAAHSLKDLKGFYEDAEAPRTDQHGGWIALDGKVVAQTKQCCHFLSSGEVPRHSPGRPS